MLPGFDVSHYQSKDTVLNALAGKPAFMFVKTSDGLNTDNPGGIAYHDIQVAMVRNAGVPVGHYHFARHVGSYKAEADHFLALAKPRPGDLLALDLEDMGGAPWSQVTAYACSWLQYVSVTAGCRPYWYVNDWWHSSILNAATAGQRLLLTKFPLWYATAGHPAGQPGVAGVSIHQWSTAGNIDHDVALIDPAVNALAGGQDMPLNPADGVTIGPAVADAVWTRFAHDGKNLAGVLEAIYDATVLAPGAPNTPAVDPKALAAALAPLVHANVDTAALATALAPVVDQRVLATLAAHPLVPKP